MNHILLITANPAQMPFAKRRVVDAFASAASFALCGVTVLVLGHWLVHPSGVKDGRFDGATNPRVFVEYLSNECALMVIAAAVYLTIALLRQQRHGGAEGDTPPGREGGGGEGAATAAAAATATAAAAASPSASLGSPLAWIASVRRRCGTSLAVVVATVYFAQGFKSIASLALAIYMKDATPIQVLSSRTQVWCLYSSIRCYGRSPFDDRPPADAFNAFLLDTMCSLGPWPNATGRPRVCVPGGSSRFADETYSLWCVVCVVCVCACVVCSG